MTTERIKAALVALHKESAVDYDPAKLDAARREASLALLDEEGNMDPLDVAIEKMADATQEALNEVRAAVHRAAGAEESIAEVKDALDAIRRDRGLIK